MRRGMHEFTQGPPIPLVPPMQGEFTITFTPNPYTPGTIFCRYCGAMPGVGDPGPCPGWQHEERITTEEVQGVQKFEGHEVRVCGDADLADKVVEMIRQDSGDAVTNAEDQDGVRLAEILREMSLEQRQSPQLEDYARDMSEHAKHLLGEMNRAGLLEDGSYCFPNGHIMEAPDGTSPEPRSMHEDEALRWVGRYGNYGPKALLRSILAEADRNPGHISKRLWAKVQLLDWKLTDACQACQGSRGGEPGNENHKGGRVLCDYCSAEDVETIEFANFCPGQFGEKCGARIRHPMTHCTKHTLK